MCLSERGTGDLDFSQDADTVPEDGPVNVVGGSGARKRQNAGLRVGGFVPLRNRRPAAPRGKAAPPPGAPESQRNAVQQAPEYWTAAPRRIAVAPNRGASGAHISEVDDEVNR